MSQRMIDSLGEQLEANIQWIRGMSEEVLRRQYWGIFNQWPEKEIEAVREEMIQHFRESAEVAKQMLSSR